MVVPLNYYRVLRARKVNSTEILRRNYENQLRDPPRVGYSKEAIDARASILNFAADCMLDYDRRREYDQKLREGLPTLSIQTSEFAGALCLLQECGDVETVVNLGTGWLRRKRGSTASRDVALAMALAYSDLASETLSNGEGVAQCCNILENGLDLLLRFQVAPALQREIAGALKELYPQCILELLALPDNPEFDEQKTKGLSLLKSVLWEIDADGRLSPSLRTRREFLENARYYMTAAQQIELYEACPEGITIPLAERYNLALAYVAEGYHTKWPQHILMAQQVFQQIASSTFSSKYDGLDVSVEIGLCSLLLGETNKAMNYLGLSLAAQSTPDRKVLAFVKANSPDSEDLLPGVCVLAELWLRDTIIPSYREANLNSSSLGEWFTSQRVSMYLEARERGNDLNLLNAASAVNRLSGTVAQGLSSAVGAVLSKIASIFRSKPPESQSKDMPLYRKPRHSSMLLPKRANGYWDSPDSEANGSRRSGRTDLAGGPSTSANGNFHDEEDQDDGAEALLKIPQAVDGQDASTNGIREDWWTGRDYVYNSGDQSHLTSGRHISQSTWMKAVVVGSVVLVAAALGSLLGRASAPVNQQGMASTDTSPAILVQRAVQAVSGVLQEGKGAIDVASAEQLIRRWHSIKSDAMGTEHDIEQLGNVLEGNLLRQWKDNAKHVEKNGWHWLYTLKGLTVDKVTMGRDGTHATVEASIKELAQLMDKGRVTDKHDTSYTVQYELVMRNGVWKINGARVVFNAA